jgi:hypothetical protein
MLVDLSAGEYVYVHARTGFLDTARGGADLQDTI